VAAEQTQVARAHPFDPDAPVAIDVVGLGVKYSLRFTRKTTVHRSFVDLFARKKPEEFWALRDVTFRLVHGVCHHMEVAGQQVVAGDDKTGAE